MVSTPNGKDELYYNTYKQALSKENNYILKNLMDWGKILYGQIKSVDEDYMSMEIKVYLSYVDVMREVKDTFNMVTDQSMGYLN